ncbi:MAG: OmpA/MotB [Tardiphaga sp.]|nr:OmpA/MotB [Tardiphaga sp.]
MLLGKPKKKRNYDVAGGHGWYVSFADLMSLMMSFFVMLLAFSTQDAGKMAVVAGSMREAFGVQMDPRYSGVFEIDGMPTRGKVRNKEQLSTDDASNTTGPNDNGVVSAEARAAAARRMVLASASLRQALQNMPELGELSKNIIMEESPAGIRLEIVDQDGRAMFAEGSKVPFERTRRLVARLALPLRATAMRLSIVGHASAGLLAGPANYDAFDLSWDRANAVRQILVGEGLPSSQLSMLAGKGDTEPLYLDNPAAAANRRVTITVLPDYPPLPPDLKP